MNAIDNHSARRLLSLTVPFTLLVMVVALWLPFGMQKIGLIEEWSAYADFDQGLPFFAANHLQTQPNRLSNILTYALGYQLTPNSFIGLNIVFIVIFVVKGILFYQIIGCLIPGNSSLAFAIAVLSILLPVDTAQLSMRVFPYHGLLIAYLSAALFLLRYVKTPSAINVVGIWFSLAICLTTLEAAFPLVLLTPVVLIPLRRREPPIFKSAIIRWYVVCVILLSINLFLLITGPRYVAQVMSTEPTQNLAERLASYLYFLAHAYYRLFVGSWVEILGRSPSNPLFPAIALLVGITTASILLFRFRLIGWQPKQINPVHYIRIFIMALIAFGIGFLPFLISPNHRSINERTFLLASLGGTVAICILMYLISRVFAFRQTVFALIFGVVMASAVLGGLEQQQNFVNYSKHEQQILRDIVMQMPESVDGSAVVLFDPENHLMYTQWIFATHDTSQHFRDALRYIYHNYALPVYVCYPTRGLWGNSQEGCKLRASEIAFVSQGREMAAFGYEQIIAFAYMGDGSVKLLDTLPATADELHGVADYEPHRLIDSAAAYPARFYTVLQN
jgi:hypothetical protein